MSYRTVTREQFEEIIRDLADTPSIESFKFMKDDPALCDIAGRAGLQLNNAVRYAKKMYAARQARVQNLEGS